MTDEEIEARQDRINGAIEEVAGSLNGFEEIALAGIFGKPLGQLPGNLQARALLFVVLRRDAKESGGKLLDKDAYDDVMARPVRDIESFFDARGEVDAGKATGTTPTPTSS